ncbi:GAF domain-containing sensor histidine kinase [Leptolyngbya sp. FACHB-261]|uniref:GAF domain-containing sensor histidine kinase n=1 Tax=Leptolyngbya sp. FACHB-261 TaxID=2692806 RepID=UPI00168962DE|nr:GAF domain-containing sensor histidine kinase [Leptolyngbya sp. FACHB-261]MBD2105195.1 GAF domain-containing protein [Leptolyngbya sp. FACHB-261]
MTDGADMESLNPEQWQQAQQALAVLASLSYRTGELSDYLQEIACGVSSLINIHWSIVTLCQDGFETVLASSIDISDRAQVYALHGRLTGTVVKTGRTLAVEDAQAHPEYGQAPEGYRSYLGVPLYTPTGEVIGTVCSFHQEPRFYTETEIRIVELFAERAATALDNYRLYQRQLQFNETLEAEVALRTTELHAAQEKLVEQERLAAIGEFATTIVHELRNPLTTVLMGLRSFKKLVLSPPFQERLALALGEATRLERLLSEILLYAKPQTLQLSPVDIFALAAEVQELISSMPEALGRQMEFSSCPVAQVLGDKDKLKQVLLNTVRNACEAVAPGETVTCTVISPTPKQVCIQIHNGGEPIPPEVLPRLTEPFYTTKSSGTGLGLAIVKRIVEAHNGEMDIQSSTLEGTRVSILLPTVV